MAGARDERVDDLFLQELSGDPNEEGQVRHRGNNIVGFVNGKVRTLLDPLICRSMDTDITIAADTTLLQASGFEIDDGVTVTIADTGELRVL